MTNQGAARALDKTSTGIAGLDQILGGGLTGNRLYLVEGSPGTGKTTLALQFLLAGAERDEPGLYIALSETAEELKAVMQSHGWSMRGLAVHELISPGDFDPEQEQSILHPSEIELTETMDKVIGKIEQLQPARVVIDSLSELRLLAQDPLRYRRQILALKHFFASQRCTVLMLDDKTSGPGDLQLHSIAHGVVNLEQAPQEYGAERRRLRIVKMRGLAFQGGSHDFLLTTGGISLFPRLVAAAHHSDFSSSPNTTGNAEMDQLLGGGLYPGTSTLICGPSGVGKTTTAVSCMLAALKQGRQATYYLFDEGLSTLLMRSQKLGMNLAPFLDSGQLRVVQIDPAELSPGQFSNKVFDGVEGLPDRPGDTFVVIDSLNAYLQSMPGQSFLLLHMHELLTYLNQRGVTTLLVMGQHGVLGETRSEIDLSYLSDTIVMFRFFEAQGQLRTAISTVKSRTAAHERSIREFKLTERGVKVGQALADFEGVMSGLPAYRGRTALLDNASA